MQPYRHPQLATGERRGSRVSEVSRRDSGFTLFEVVIVVTLLAFIVSLVAPNLNMRTTADAQSRVARLQEDVRAAFDMAVLTGRPYRMVFMLAKGDYWLEEADKEQFFLGDEQVNFDLSAEDEKNRAEDFDQGFKEYEELAGEAIRLADEDDEIPPTSPLVEAKERLKPPTWSKVDSLEWRERTLAPTLIIREMQAEHHARKQLFSELGEDARGMIYFFPSGRMERAYIHLAFRDGDMGIDEKQAGWTVTTDPWMGVAEAVSGFEEVDITRDDRRS